MRRNKWAAVAMLSSLAAFGQKVEMVAVVQKAASRTVELPGEFEPFQQVAIHAKVRGYVERVLVDRGSFVKRGQLLVILSAPEVAAQRAEAQARELSMEADRAQAEAQLAAAQSTAERLKQASATVGAISANELVLAGAQVDAARALVAAKRGAVTAAEAAVREQRDLEAYLQITAPFAGVVTERMAHPGALVGPGNDEALMTLQDVSRLRLVVAVPEAQTGGIVRGGKVEFRAPAAPGRTYFGTVARVSHALNAKTRTMAVELDVVNRDGTLAPGMYPAVKWPVRQAGAALLVPKTSVVTTAERTFVIRKRDGKADWVTVQKGSADGDNVEVMGKLSAGEFVVKRASDEIRDGAALR